MMLRALLLELPEMRTEVEKHEILRLRLIFALTNAQRSILAQDDIGRGIGEESKYWLDCRSSKLEESEI